VRYVTRALPAEDADTGHRFAQEVALSEIVGNLLNPHSGQFALVPAEFVALARQLLFLGTKHDPCL
jgi:hypothetical protein